MFANYIKTTLRFIIRHQTFSIINITGLSIGLSASIIIAMWVFDELSYDKFHDKAAEIYRIERYIQEQGSFIPVTGAVYGKTLLYDYPEIIDMVRVDFSRSAVTVNKKRFNEIVHYVDASFFNIFSFPLTKGDPHTALIEPGSLILSQKAAKKFFGDEDPMNKILPIESNGVITKYKITGVLKDLPFNKHFQFEMLASFSTLMNFYREEKLNSWVSNYLYTYVLLHKGSDKELLEEKLGQLVVDKIQPAYISSYNDKEKGNIKLFLRPLTEIHLASGLKWDIEVQGDIILVYIFSVISFMILLIASFNFMSLSTALANSRAKEVGIRKTLGSTKGQLVKQFIFESILISLISFFIAVGIIQPILPYFNNLADKSLSLGVFVKPSNLIVLIVIVLGTGFFSGIYPAFYLSAMKPIMILKGKSQKIRRKVSFWQVLVVLQFTISIVMIIGTIIVLKQINYFHNKPLGYDKENIMVVPVESQYVQTHYMAFKTDLLKNPIIISVASSSSVPAERDYSDTGWETDIQDEMFISRFFAVNWDFFKTYKLKILAGRAFSEKQSTDRNFKVIINETAAKMIGYLNPEDAIGKKWHSDLFTQQSDTLLEGQIIGVVKDFYFQSLKTNSNL